MSESIRGALLSVDEGQKEAAYSLGMTNFQLVTRIVIPQAVVWHYRRFLTTSLT